MSEQPLAASCFGLRRAQHMLGAVLLLPSQRHYSSALNREKGGAAPEGEQESPHKERPAWLRTSGVPQACSGGSWVLTLAVGTAVTHECLNAILAAPRGTGQGAESR